MSAKRPWWLALGEGLADALEQSAASQQAADPAADLGRQAPAESRQEDQSERPTTPEVPTPNEVRTADDPTCSRRPASRGESPGPRPDPPTATQEVRECLACCHYRAAGPLVAGVLAVMPTRTMANSDAVKEAERAESAEIAEEVNGHFAAIDAAMLLPSEARDAHSASRPMAYPYCGAHEMDMKFELVEIKNADQDCREFAPAGAGAARSCETCASLRTPVGPLVTLVQKPFNKAGRNGTQLFKDSVQQPLKLRADLELDEVIRRQGLVTGTPAHLPYCATLSSLRATVIGPLVNVGSECSAWSARGSAAPAEWQTLLHELESMEQRLEVFTLNEPMGAAAAKVDYILTEQRDVMSQAIQAAELPFVEAGLRGMGFEPNEARSICEALAPVQEAHRLSPSKF